ncbi:MBL fold metallo-hydrolase [Gangjinia marincola]|uniref:MBL fold metallo-hydrolase n=1 Tax=Gangjinia marincola TaxID=578463 RepID=A0ABN1MCV7_9FLAO
MKITFLGTGTSQGIPVIGSTHPVCMSDDPKDKRLRVSILVECETETFVIDCGPDFRTQLLANPVNHIDGVVFTHEHSDHIAGLDDIRPFYFRQGDVSLYAEDRVIEALKKRYHYMFVTENKYPGVPTFDIHQLINKPFNLKQTTITPIQVYHGKLPVFGYRIHDFAYITDAKTIPDEELKKLEGLDVLVLNALREEPHHSHLNIEEALEIIKKVKPKKTYFTHISHYMGFHAEVEESLPKNVHLAYDNLTLEL